MQPASTVGLPG